MKLDPFKFNFKFFKTDSQCLSKGKVFNANLILKPEMGHYFLFSL